MTLKFETFDAPTIISCQTDIFRPESGRTPSLLPIGIALIWIAVSPTAPAQNPGFAWVRQVQSTGSTTGENSGRAIAVDRDGNILVAGYFTANATFGTNTLTTRQDWNPDMFVAKYDTGGNVLWVRQAGGTHICKAYSLAVDGEANSYVAGFFCCGTVTFGNTNLTPLFETVGDTFLAKYDTAGNLLWVRNHQSIKIDPNNLNVAADRVGNAYLTGIFRGAVSFGDSSLTNHGYDDSDFFVAKYDSSGNNVWARAIGSVNPEYWPDTSQAITADADGSVYLTGRLEHSTDFGTNNIPEGPFVAKYDAAGNLVRVLGGIGGRIIAGAEMGNFVAMSEVAFQGESPAKYDAYGNLVWRAPSFGYASGVAVDSESNVYVVGRSSPPVIAVYGPSGALRSVVIVNTGATGFAQGAAIAASTGGVAYVTGTFSGLNCFGTNCMDAPGPRIFVAAITFPAAIITLTEQPQGQLVSERMSATFHVSAADEGPFSYQWRRDGNDLANDGRISGATSDTLTIQDVQLADMGLYDVMVRNSAAWTTSDPAFLSVIPLRLSGPFRRTDGRWQYTFPTEAGRTYLIQASTNLLDWTSLLTLPGDGNSINFIDPNASSLPFRFYRFRLE